MNQTIVLFCQPKTIQEQINEAHEQMNEKGFKCVATSITERKGPILGIPLIQVCITYEKAE